jgi:hypothetical protein
LNFEMNKLKLIRMPCAGLRLGRSFKIRPAAGAEESKPQLPHPVESEWILYTTVVLVLVSNTEKKSNKGTSSESDSPAREPSGALAL